MPASTAPIAAGQTITVAAVTVATLVSPFAGAAGAASVLEAACEIAAVPAAATVTVTFVGSVSGITYGTRQFLNAGAGAVQMPIDAVATCVPSNFPASEAILVKMSSSTLAGATTAGFAACIG